MIIETASITSDPKALRLNNLLPNMPEPCPTLKLVKVVGEGTFSTVYLMKRDKTMQGVENAGIVRNDPSWRRWYALKHLIPTSSPERILMEIECLRLSNGRQNVVPLLFCHRILGDVILVMPYIPNNKFNEVIRTMDHVEMKAYLRNLLLAISHIHSLGIIHRDIKPANFLYDRQRRRYGLVDFGLAQRGQPPISNLCTLPDPNLPECKRKLDSSELAGEQQEPRTPTPSKRMVLEDRTTKENNSWQRASRHVSNPRTPTFTEYHKPTPYYYNKRGCLLKNGSPGKKYINHRNRLKSEENISFQEPGEQTVGSSIDTEDVISNMVSTPKKNKNFEVGQTPTLRRSPRKLSTHGNRVKPNVIVPAQHCSTLEAWQLPRRSPRKHPSTLEAIKPQSIGKGARSAQTPLVGKAKTPEMTTQGGRKPTGYSKLTISGSAIVPSGGQGQTTNTSASSCLDNIATPLATNTGRQVGYNKRT